MKNQISYSPEARAVRLVFKQRKEYESQWAVIRSVASKKWNLPRWNGWISLTIANC